MYLTLDQNVLEIPSPTSGPLSADLMYATQGDLNFGFPYIQNISQYTYTVICPFILCAFKATDHLCCS